MSKLMKALVFGGLVSMSIGVNAMENGQQVVIAHRGASGYLPEHTLPSKALAYQQGADYLEQDLVMTKDDRLIVLHDHFLDRVTDVAEKFPGRARADGRFYAIDFTLAEIKSLKFTEGFDIKDGEKVAVYPLRFPLWASDFRIHTFEEELEFIQGLNKTMKRNVGIYPEIKAPWLHRAEGKDISTKVLEVLKAYGYDSRDDNVFLQCFDANELKRIKSELLPKMGMDLPLVQLIARTDWEETFEKDVTGKLVNYSYDWMFEKEAMKKIAEYADAIGPQYPMLLEPEQSLKEHRIILSSMGKEAHENGLLIHPYTLRADALPPYAKSMDELLEIMYDQVEVEGLFTDFPDLAVNYLNAKQKK